MKGKEVNRVAAAMRDKEVVMMMLMDIVEADYGEHIHTYVCSLLPIYYLTSVLHVQQEGSRVSVCVCVGFFKFFTQLSALPLQFG